MIEACDGQLDVAGVGAELLAGALGVPFLLEGVLFLEPDLILCMPGP